MPRTMQIVAELRLVPKASNSQFLHYPTLSRPLHTWSRVVWTMSCFNSKHEVVVPLNSDPIGSWRELISTVGWPSLWEDDTSCDGSWVSHWGGPYFLRVMPLRKMKKSLKLYFLAGLPLLWAASYPQGGSTVVLLASQLSLVEFLLVCILCGIQPY